MYATGLQNTGAATRTNHAGSPSLALGMPATHMHCGGTTVSSDDVFL